MKDLIDQLLRRCHAPKESFRELGEYRATKTGDLTFIDNGGTTLAVAHLDHYGPSIPRVFKNVYGYYGVQCEQLDDRLGAWVLLDLLPQFTDIKYDILLTDSEETGNSTAQWFETQKKYNWIWEFDRAGMDVVMYDYETDEAMTILENSGFEVGMGSFTDICYLEQLGCQGFNFGVGYHDQHTPKCFAMLRDVLYQVQKFRYFLENYCDTHFAWDASMKPYYGTGKSRYASYGYGKWWPKKNSNFDDDGPVYVQGDDGVWRKVTEDTDLYDRNAGDDDTIVYPDKGDDCFGFQYCDICGENLINDNEYCPYCDRDRYWEREVDIECRVLGRDPKDFQEFCDMQRALEEKGHLDDFRK